MIFQVELLIIFVFYKLAKEHGKCNLNQVDSKYLPQLGYVKKALLYTQYVMYFTTWKWFQKHNNGSKRVTHKIMCLQVCSLLWAHWRALVVYAISKWTLE
jgi:hypothetical protein